MTKSINLPAEMWKKLKVIADEQNRSVSNLVMYIVKQYLGD